MVWLFFLICFIASYKIKIILSCYYLMFINFLKLFEYLDFLYELLLEISKKKTSFRGQWSQLKKLALFLPF